MLGSAGPSALAWPSRLVVSSRPACGTTWEESWKLTTGNPGLRRSRWPSGTCSRDQMWPLPWQASQFTDTRVLVGARPLPRHVGQVDVSRGALRPLRPSRRVGSGGMTTFPVPPQYPQNCSIIWYASTLPVPSHLLQPVAMLSSAYRRHRHTCRESPSNSVYSSRW
jgi:hypothetical protein